jgi:hypothetical protein
MESDLLGVSCFSNYFITHYVFGCFEVIQFLTLGSKILTGTFAAFSRNHFVQRYLLAVVASAVYRESLQDPWRLEFQP